jgi:hypothetical protein
MDETLLVNGFKTILRNIYSSKEYYRRALDCLSRFHVDRIEPRTSTLAEDARALYRIIVKLGIRDRERRQFWNYFFRLVRFHPRDFAHGLTLAAMGYHFRQITIKYCE